MELYQRAKSHADNLMLKVEALRAQGQAITASIVGQSGPMPILTVAGVSDNGPINEVFILDNDESLAACAEFTSKLHELSLSLPLPMGDVVCLGSAA